MIGGKLYINLRINNINCLEMQVETLDGNRNVVKILGRENNEIWLRFNSKLSVTLKIILLGFCINMVCLRFNQIKLFLYVFSPYSNINYTSLFRLIAASSIVQTSFEHKR